MLNSIKNLCSNKKVKWVSCPIYEYALIKVEKCCVRSPIIAHYSWRRRGLLGSDELWVVYEAVLVLVVALQDWVDHVLKLNIHKYFLLWFRLPGLGVMVCLVVPVDEGLDELQPVQLVVTVSVVHPEVVEL